MSEYICSPEIVEYIRDLEDEIKRLKAVIEYKQAEINSLKKKLECAHKGVS